MNQAYANLINRRSIKKFQNIPIKKELINKVIEAGLKAPSSLNRQETIIIAITNQTIRNQIIKANNQIKGKNPNFDPFYGAPCILIVLGLKQNPNRVYDGSLVMGNLMNAAHALNLGSCWIHKAKEEFETEEFKELLKTLNINDEYEGIGHCALGYQDGESPQPPKIKEGRVYFIE